MTRLRNRFQVHVYIYISIPHYFFPKNKDTRIYIYSNYIYVHIFYRMRFICVSTTGGGWATQLKANKFVKLEIFPKEGEHVRILHIFRTMSAPVCTWYQHDLKAGWFHTRIDHLVDPQSTQLPNVQNKAFRPTYYTYTTLHSHFISFHEVTYLYTISET